jgi:hypothetical protein
MAMGASVTVDNLDGDTLERLNLEAQRRGLNVGALVKQMIRDGLPPASLPPESQTYRDLDCLAGTWSKADVEEFLSATARFNAIDEDLWK